MPEHYIYSNDDDDDADTDGGIFTQQRPIVDALGAQHTHCEREVDRVRTQQSVGAHIERGQIGKVGSERWKEAAKAIERQIDKDGAERRQRRVGAKETGVQMWTCAFDTAGAITNVETEYLHCSCKSCHASLRLVYTVKLVLTSRLATCGLE
jgi:hypothetical protein